MSSIQVQVFGEHLSLHGTVDGIRRAQSSSAHVLFLKRKQFLLNSLNSLDSNLLATSVGTSGELTFRFVLSVCRPCEYNASGRLTSLLDIMLSVYLSAFVMRYMINGGYTRSETRCSICIKINICVLIQHINAENNSCLVCFCRSREICFI